MILNNKVALVTGGNRGIGYCVSKTLAKNGANVILTFKDQEQSAIQAVKKIGERAKCLKVDVCDRTSVKFAFDFCEKNFGKIDILVNNAGINKPEDFDKVTDKDWDEVLNVNLKGPFICSQIAMSFMKNQKGGSIINIGSVSGQYGGPRTPHYASSKAGLISLSQVTARFGASYGVRCNTIAAGFIESEMADQGIKDAHVKKISETIPLKRFGSPQEVADAVVFLSSDSSSYITAQTINVNGGLYF